LIASGIALALLVQQIFAQPGISAVAFYPTWLPPFVHFLEAAKRFGVQWITLALLLAFAWMRLSVRLAREETMAR
jgi:hypothetical protein